MNKKSSHAERIEEYLKERKLIINPANLLRLMNGFTFAKFSNKKRRKRIMHSAVAYYVLSVGISVAVTAKMSTSIINADNTDEAVSATIRLWKNVSTDEKRRFAIQGCVNYPEIFKGDYDWYALWLTSQGVVDPHIRDQFSAGGKEPLRLSNGDIVKFPGVYRRIRENVNYFIRLMALKEPALPIEKAPVHGEALSSRLLEWCKAVSMLSPHDFDESMDALQILFFGGSYKNGR